MHGVCRSNVRARRMLTKPTLVFFLISNSQAVCKDIALITQTPLAGSLCSGVQGLEGLKNKKSVNCACVYFTLTNLWVLFNRLPWPFPHHTHRKMGMNIFALLKIKDYSVYDLNISSLPPVCPIQVCPHFFVLSTHKDTCNQGITSCKGFNRVTSIQINKDHSENVLKTFFY